MKIPKTTQGVGGGSNEIPSWIKNNAGWWADGTRLLILYPRNSIFD